MLHLLMVSHWKHFLLAPEAFPATLVFRLKDISSMHWSLEGKSLLTGEGGDFPSLLHTREAHLSSRATSTGKMWSCWNRSRSRPQGWSEGWSASPVKIG